MRPAFRPLNSDRPREPAFAPQALEPFQNRLSTATLARFEPRNEKYLGRTAVFSMVAILSMLEIVAP